MNSWISMLQDAAEMFVFLAVELSLLFIVISAGVSLIRQKVPDHKIQQMMGARKGRGYLLAALLGAVTPFCSCSTIPMLRGLLSAKAGFGPTLTFLFVSPLLPMDWMGDCHCFFCGSMRWSKYGFFHPNASPL